MPTGPKPGIPAPIMKVIHEGTMLGKNWATLFYNFMLTSGTPTAADVLSIITAQHSAYGSHLQALKSDTSTLQTTKGVFIPSPGTEITAEYSSPIAGIQHITSLPNNVALGISWGIDSYYRGGHPRSYMDSIPTGDNTNTTDWSSAAITAWEAAASAYSGAVNGLTSTHFAATTLGTVRFASHNSWLTPPEWFQYITVTVHPRIDSQRRRLGKET